jgi:YVTN family beta-propeller protein
VGNRPQAIAVDSGAHRVYVASTHDNIVAVIDGARNSLSATLKVDGGPFSMAADDVTGKIFVNDLAGASPTVIDGRKLTMPTAVSAP